jgi:Flp pilus assembly protein TadD
MAMLVMPWLTLPNHRVLPVSSAVSTEFWVPLAAIALIGAAFLIFAMRYPKRHLYLFCAAWMVVTLAPMMVLHSVPQLAQDYNLYLPSVGWCILAGDLIASIAARNALARNLALGGALAMLVLYAVALWRVQWFYHDDVAAARGYVEGYPESVGWHWTLATYLDHQGDYKEAEQEIRTALSLEPDRTGIKHPNSGELHHFLGELLARHGDIDGAEAELAKSVSSPPDEDEVQPPRSPLAYNHDGVALYDRGLSDAKEGRTELAVQEMSAGLEMMKRLPVPDYGPLALRYIPLAELYDSLNNQEQVEAVLREVDSMSEGELAAGLARAKIRLNHSDKAGAEQILRGLSERYQTSWEILFPLADLEFKQGQYREALSSYQRAHAGWFGGAQLHLEMAQSLHAMGRDNEAYDQCRLAQALAPRDRSIQFFCAELQNH